LKKLSCRKSDARATAQMVTKACGEPKLPYVIAALTPDMAWDMHGLAPIADQELLTYRSAARQFV